MKVRLKLWTASTEEWLLHFFNRDDYATSLTVTNGMCSGRELTKVLNNNTKH